jgi:hypothetical protein
MDHYPQVNVEERECASRRDSNASSINKTSMQHSLNHKTHESHLVPPQYTSFPSPDNHDGDEQHRDRNDSFHSTADEDEAKSQHIEAEYARYTDAPPPYSEKQYEGKSEEQQVQMRMADYAKEIKRMMGKQLVRGLKTGETKTES